LVAQFSSSTSITATWELPVVTQRNGVVTSFTVSYTRPASQIYSAGNALACVNALVDDVCTFTVTRSPAFELSLATTVADLESYVDYTFTVWCRVVYLSHTQVNAFTSAGMGPPSGAVTARTDQDVPAGPVEGLGAVAQSSSSILVTWSAPLGPVRRGVVTGYRISATR
jgi:hypothetical protein